MEMSLSPREVDVLRAVILHYIRTASPVGSKTVSARHGIPFSAATVRNIMAELEEKGLMYQPHTSAGRVPTHSGIRYFLDNLVYVDRLSRRMRAQIEEITEEAPRNLPEFFHKTSRMLSHISNQASVVLLPSLSRTALEKIQIIKVSDAKALVVLLTTSGMVHSIVVVVEEGLSARDLDRYCAYLNDSFRGLTLTEARDRIMTEINEHKDLFDMLYSRMLTLSERALSLTVAEEELLIEGRANLLNHPEFSDIETMREIFAAFEDRCRILRLLDQSLGAEGVRVTLGSECGDESIRGVSLISSPYFGGDTMLGTLGVIGPVRMDYPRLMPVVDYTAKIVSRLLKDMVS